MKNETKEIVFEVVRELKRQGYMKNNTAFQKTETILYNYNRFKESVEEKKREIEEIEKYGLKKQSCSILKYNESTNSFKSDEDKKQEQIDILIYKIEETEKYINLIDKALDRVKNDIYYNIIVLKYFNNKTREDIAEHFEIDVSTVSRNKNRLVNEIALYLFSDEVIADLFI